MEDLQYVGFWSRFWASMIDMLILMMIIYPIFYMIYGSSFIERAGEFSILNNIINILFPFIAVIVLWRSKGATPGKMFIKATIVDQVTLGKPSTKQLIVRYFAYILSAIPLFLGYFWAGWDKRKQTWHDKLAHTVVVQPKKEKKTKGVGSYIAIGFGIFAIVVFTGLMTLGYMAQSGMMPNGDVYTAQKLPKDVKIDLIEKGLLQKEEKLYYYQPHSIFRYTGSGTMITDKGIRYFEEGENGLPWVWDFPYTQIKKLEKEKESLALGIEVVMLTLYDDEDMEMFSVGLGSTKSDVKKIEDKIIKLWNDAKQ